MNWTSCESGVNSNRFPVMRCCLYPMFSHRVSFLFCEIYNIFYYRDGLNYMNGWIWMKNALWAQFPCMVIIWYRGILRKRYISVPVSLQGDAAYIWCFHMLWQKVSFQFCEIYNMVQFVSFCVRGAMDISIRKVELRWKMHYQKLIL